MNKYELTLIIDHKSTPAKKKKVQEMIEKSVSLLGGKIIKFEDWGEKEFAYDIGKNSSGVYLFFELEVNPSAAKSLNDKLRVEGDIIRYLLVKVS
ncbi:MAG: 30S ribosomal protein S6 [Patescibacteria group bacterium]|nr:MAG: 30S ribosomal protein S6 [Patescibacteria group bacterium]